MYAGHGSRDLEAKPFNPTYNAVTPRGSSPLHLSRKLPRLQTTHHTSRPVHMILGTPGGKYEIVERFGKQGMGLLPVVKWETTGGCHEVFPASKGPNPPHVPPPTPVLGVRTTRRSVCIAEVLQQRAPQQLIGLSATPPPLQRTPRTNTRI